MKLTKLISVAAMALTVFGFASCSKAQKSNKFILGLDASFPPMGYTEADGSIVGYDIDLAKEAAKRLGLEFEAKPIDWDAKEMELSTGNIDCIWNGFTMTEERVQAMSFSKAYLNNDQVLVVRKDSGINSLADAAGKIVGIQAGSSAEEAVNDNKDFAASLKELKTYADNLVALTDLEVGGIDAVVMDSVVANYSIKTGNKPLVVVADPLAKEAYGIGFRKDEAGAKLRDDIQKTLEEMAADGTVAKISENWFGTDISVIGK
ncbi:MAG: amino acid ABC transporter substrate-binding protein [Treponema sp.]|nr:amino acid ABC transporter substrate-binding protein [Candidatus Treponema equifaecale]